MPEPLLLIRLFLVMPLILTNVRGCCGTRIKNWTKDPVTPDESGAIQVEGSSTAVASEQTQGPEGM